MDGVTACSYQALSFTGCTQGPASPRDALEAGDPQSSTQDTRHWEGAPERCGGSLVPTVLLLGVEGSQRTVPQDGHRAPMCFCSSFSLQSAHMLKMAPAFKQSEERARHVSCLPLALVWQGMEPLGQLCPWETGRCPARK